MENAWLKLRTDLQVRCILPTSHELCVFDLDICGCGRGLRLSGLHEMLSGLTKRSATDGWLSEPPTTRSDRGSFLCATRMC